MFWDDIKLVTEQIEKYGLRKPFVDLGGLDRPVIADYDLTLHTGDQQARFVSLSQRPFDHIDREYLVVNPEQGDPFIEDLPKKYNNAFGTAVCLSVLEHVGNPFEVFQALYQIMKPNSILILSTVFSYPYHPSPNDYWRYTPACLRHLSESVGFQVLECDWRLTIPADKGIRAVQDGTLLEVKSVYATLAKGDFQASPNSVRYALPQRTSRNPQANQFIAQESQKLQVSASTPSTSNSPVVLVYSDVSGSSGLTQNADRVLSGLAQTGQTVIYAHPKSQKPVTVRPDIQYQELSYDPNADFSKTFTVQDEARSLLNQLNPSLTVFVDSCPVSNFAAKQIVAQAGIPFIQIVGSAVPQVAQNFVPCLKEVKDWHEKAQATIAFSQPTLQNLQQYFGLPAAKGKVIEGGVPVPDYLPAISMKSPNPAPTTAVTPPTNRPQWEYLPQGWKTQDPNILGWNVQSILETQRKKWPAFVRSLQGTNPLGINHESPVISSGDYGSHNTMMTYGYVLAKAARQKERISILDWGGGLGHYYLLSKALLPEVEIDYYCKDLPILCQGGRELLPEVTFYEDETECFQNSYDLVVSSSSLQYSEDWQDTVRKLSQVTNSYLLITRLPIVRKADSFVVVQRPYAYGYHTEYITWFLNRNSLVEYTTNLGMRFLREFLIAEKFPVPNAPEVAEARGFLFSKP
ncbi:methyltransferase, TIGR04325 family, partial [Baaleninema sp.]|uniref:methyltransferase, TIGR04325 family n=1 Tax=Baaleninema sp. TaxID=3101197 RepID=UPI003D02F0B3